MASTAMGILLCPEIKIMGTLGFSSLILSIKATPSNPGIFTSNKMQSKGFLRALSKPSKGSVVTSTSKFFVDNMRFNAFKKFASSSTAKILIKSVAFKSCVTRLYSYSFGFMFGILSFGSTM